MTSNVVVVVLSALVMTLAKSLTSEGSELTLAGLHHLGYELLGSVALGTTLGLVMVLYLRFVGQKLLVVLVALGFGFTEILSYLRLEPLLTFLVAGFLVQNLSPYGEKLLNAIEDLASVVYVVFFATAGAQLDLPLLHRHWVVALVLFGSRFFLTWLASRLASRLAGDPPAVRTWGFSGFLAQAGVTFAVAGHDREGLPVVRSGHELARHRDRRDRSGSRPGAL